MREMVVCATTALLVGSCAYFLVRIHVDAFAREDDCTRRFPLTNHTLDCSLYDDLAARMEKLDGIVSEAAQNYRDAGKATSISVWVRDLKSLRVAKENQLEAYSPASMMKVPVMIAYFRFAEVDPSILEQPLKYDGPSGDTDALQTFRSETTLKPGETYPVLRLIEEMITNSDNRAADVLLAHMDENFFKKTLTELGIVIPASASASEQDFVTAKTYANIFRMLYNASYLNREYSQKALELLTRTKFRLLAKELPQNVVVASKFGERVFQYDDGTVKERRLHDCGIVYKKDHPYTICVMTKGHDFDEMKSVIIGISKTVYDAI